MVPVLLMLINYDVLTINHITLCGPQFVVCNFLPIATAFTIICHVQEYIIMSHSLN